MIFTTKRCSCEVKQMHICAYAKARICKQILHTCVFFIYTHYNNRAKSTTLPAPRASTVSVAEVTLASTILRASAKLSA